MPLFHRCLFASAAALALAASPASATWSILIVDTRTGEIVIASATCVETIDLRRETPVLITGIGAVTAQSAVDGSGFTRMLIRDRLLQGVPLESVLEELAQRDAGHDNRQYGIITADGETLTYSGIQNANWAGGITGRIERGRPGPADDIVYTVQGNILSGPNVVQDAVDAIINTDSDLPGRLMAAMQAAQAGGGDGRCSCSNADPTGCGSPPPGPFKSAHVGYMLGTRADDIDAVRAFYPITNAAGGMTIADLDHNGFPDVIIGDATLDEISIFMNTANAGDPLSHVLPMDVRSIGAAQTIGMATGDFNNDGYDDVAIALASPPTLAIMLGQDAGVLGELVTHPLPAAPTGIAAGNLLDGPTDEIAVSIGSLGIVQLFTLDTTLNPNHIVGNDTILIDGNPSTITIGQLVGDNAPDLAIAQRDANAVTIFENRGLDGFVTTTTLATAAQPNKLVLADLDLDSQSELVVLSESGRRVEIYADDGTQWSQTNSFPVNRNGIGLAIGDFNDDALPDIITTSSSPQRNLQVFANDGIGGFGFDGVVRVGSSSRFVELIDMNNNGDLDLVIANTGNDGLMLIDNPRGTALSAPGFFANGDYFLELNIANQRQADPDPVDQLADLFDAWRLSLENKIDAVHTEVIARHRVGTGSSNRMVVKLRDWQGNLLPITEPGNWSISASDGVSTTAPILISPGVFEFSLIAGDQAGTQSLIIRVGEGDEQVRLMPDFEVIVLENLADFNADGVLNFFDISLFLQAFHANDLDADFDGSGSIDFKDIVVFINTYSN